MTPAPHIDDVEPLNDADLVCFAEIRDVLKRHGKLDRFFIGLLHRHFETHDDEVMLEQTDVESRTQTIKPVKQSEVSSESIDTAWRLSDGEAMAWCERKCEKNMFGQHKRGHNYY